MGPRLKSCFRLLAAAVAVAGAVAQAEAREVLTRADLRTQYDWTRADRQAWWSGSRQSSRENLPAYYKEAQASNTFVRSSLAITEHQRPGEFETHEQRRAYFDLVGSVLECNESPVLRSIRFFHMAAEVAGRETAAADSLPGNILGRDARQLLDDLHRHLFQADLKVVRDLLFASQDTQTPGGALKVVNAMTFDIAMIDFEQGLVEQMLAARRYPAEALSRINVFIGLNPSIVVAHIAPYDLARDLVTQSGLAGEDFANKRWRIALGRALVFLFHGRVKPESVYAPTNVARHHLPKKTI